MLSSNLKKKVNIWLIKYCSTDNTTYIMLPGNSGPAPESEPDIEITEKGQRVPSLFEKGLLWRRFMEVEVHSQG